MTDYGGNVSPFKELTFKHIQMCNRGLDEVFRNSMSFFHAYFYDSVSVGVIKQYLALKATFGMFTFTAYVLKGTVSPV
jgi:hypothetical protein